MLANASSAITNCNAPCRTNFWGEVLYLTSKARVRQWVEPLSISRYKRHRCVLRGWICMSRQRGSFWRQMHTVEVSPSEPDRWPPAPFRDFGVSDHEWASLVHGSGLCSHTVTSNGRANTCMNKSHECHDRLLTWDGIGHAMLMDSTPMRYFRYE